VLGAKDLASDGQIFIIRWHQAGSGSVTSFTCTAHVIGDSKGHGSWASSCGERKIFWKVAKTPAVNQLQI
jgi:hypothetical protein